MYLWNCVNPSDDAETTTSGVEETPRINMERSTHISITIESRFYGIQCKFWHWRCAYNIPLKVKEHFLREGEGAGILAGDEGCEMKLKGAGPIFVGL